MLFGYIFLPEGEITQVSNYIPENYVRKETVHSFFCGISKEQR
jgi:hypothetical protein